MYSEYLDLRNVKYNYDCHTFIIFTILIIVEQIMGPIVQIVIQAPHLARMFVGGYWSNLPDGPLENPRWRPCFQDGRHFHYSIFFNKMHLFGGFQ